SRRLLRSVTCAGRGPGRIERPDWKDMRFSPWQALPKKRCLELSGAQRSSKRGPRIRIRGPRLSPDLLAGLFRLLRLICVDPGAFFLVDRLIQAVGLDAGLEAEVAGRLGLA